MPIFVCEFCRAYFSKCFKGKVSYGIPQLKKQTYLGFKFYTHTTIDVFLTDYIIAQANIDDRSVGFINTTSIKLLVYNISFLINKLMRNYQSVSKIKMLVFG